MITLDEYINEYMKPIKRKKINWIILTIAGLFEVAFAFCLGKAKETSGNEMYL